MPELSLEAGRQRASSELYKSPVDHIRKFTQHVFTRVFGNNVPVKQVFKLVHEFFSEIVSVRNKRPANIFSMGFKKLNVQNTQEGNIKPGHFPEHDTATAVASAHGTRPVILEPFDYTLDVECMSAWQRVHVLFKRVEANSAI